MRIVAVGECLVAVLIHSNVVKTVRVGDICIQRQPLVCADAVGSERRMIVGKSETGPIEEAARELGGGVCSRAGHELRLDAVEHVSKALVGDVTGEPTTDTGGATGERGSAQSCASRQHGFEERLRRGGGLRVNLLRHSVESLREALATCGHEEGHLVEVNALVDIARRVADVPDFQAAVPRKLALDGEIEGIVRTRRPLRVLHERVGDDRNICVGDAQVARHDRRHQCRINRWQRDGGAVQADPEAARRVCPAVAAAIGIAGRI